MILGLEHATVCLTQDKTTNYAQNRASFLITACSQVDVQFSGGYPRANRKLRAAVLPQCKEAQSRQWRMLSPASLRPFISFCDCCVETKSSTIRFNVKFWEVIADNLSKAGWSWGCVATVDSNGQTIFVADAHRDNGKRFIVTADEKLRAFLELQRVTREALRS